AREPRAFTLAVGGRDAIVQELPRFEGWDCPAAIVVRASWPDQRVLRGTLADIAARAKAEPIERTAMIFVGRALAMKDFRDSALYDAAYQRRFRSRGA